MTPSEQLDSGIWRAITDDIDDLATLELSIRRRISGDEFDEVRQKAAIQILGRLRREPKLLIRFENRDTRRSFISTALKFAAISRKRDAWHKYARALDSIAEPETHQSPLKEALRADRKAFLNKVADELPPESNARFVLEHFLRGITIEAYAQARGVSSRTAYRRFNEGIRALRTHLAELGILPVD